MALSLLEVDALIAKLTNNERLARINPKWRQIALYKLRAMRTVIAPKGHVVATVDTRSKE